MSVVIKAEDLYKSYTLPHGKVEVLAGAYAEIVAGESVAIVGRSGSGKSTLMHILGGLDQPDRGSLHVLQENLVEHVGSGISAKFKRFIKRGQRASMRAQGIGFIFQSYHLLPELDVMENVCLPAMSGAHPGGMSAARERAGQMLEKVGLAHRLQHHPNELSGGEQQRVAIVRALINNPPLILADEPTGNLDEKTGMAVLDALFDLGREEGATLVMVTHNHDVAARCERTLLLEGGKLVES